MKLHIDGGRYAIATLPPEAPLPSLPARDFFALIRDKDELTLILPEDAVPAGVAEVVRGYRLVMLDERFPFDAVGVLARCTTRLAAAGIPVLAYSSFKTDLFLIPDKEAAAAVDILSFMELG